MPEWKDALAIGFCLLVPELLAICFWLQWRLDKQIELNEELKRPVRERTKEEVRQSTGGETMTLTMQQTREYVIAAWGTSITIDRGHRKNWLRVGIRGTLFEGESLDGVDDPRIWEAAYLFTVKCEQVIADLEEEIGDLQAAIDDLSENLAACKDAGAEEGMFAEAFNRSIKIYGRILASEQAALAELKRGLREVPRG